jgi:hypothetical protein
LKKLQNQCIRKIFEAYKATNDSVLEKEVEIPSITTALKKVMANAIRRQAIISGGKIITQACERIRRNAMLKRHRRLQNNGLTPSETKAKWLREKVSEKL